MEFLESLGFRGAVVGVAGGALSSVDPGRGLPMIDLIAIDGTVGGTDPFEGSGQLQLSNNSDNWVSRLVNLDGLTSAILSFQWRATGFGGGDVAYVKIYDGNWFTLLAVVDGDDDNNWHLATFDLSGYNFNSNFLIQFEAGMNQDNDDFFIDDVKITGTQ